MSVIVVSLPHPAVDDGTVDGWRRQHPSRNVITEIENYEPAVTGLFGHDPGTEIQVEFAPVGVVRDIITTAGDTDVMIITQKPLRGKIDATVVNLSFPSANKLPDFIANTTGVSRTVAASCVRRYPNPSSAISAARQASLLAPGERLGGMIDPSPGDTPPWDILDAVFAGDARTAAEETKKVIHVTGDAMGLFFQLSGFLRKTVTAPVDGGSDYFRSRHRRITDVHGVVEDIAWFSDVVMEVPKRHRGVVVASFTGSIASRCR